MTEITASLPDDAVQGEPVEGSVYNPLSELLRRIETRTDPLTYSV